MTISFMLWFLVVTLFIAALLLIANDLEGDDE